MALLIDCYNVLHTTMPPMLGGLDEGGLCRALGRTGWARRGTQIVVVADGAPKPLGATRSPVDSVELVYSGGSSAGGGLTADDVIIRRIDAAPAPRRLTVVSSDRAIRVAAGRRSARSWTSDFFINRLCEQLRSSRGNPQDAAGAPRPVIDELPSEHVEGWMDEMGLTDSDAGEMTSPDSKPRPPAADDFDLDGLDMGDLEGEHGFGSGKDR